jgi:hypothetical protein
MYYYVFAYIQLLAESIFQYANRLRREIVLPLAKVGGRDMVLLKSGAWIDDDARIPCSQVKMRYDSEKHTVFLVPHMDKPVRDPWLSVTAEGRDLSDFFCDLRVPANMELSNETKIMLFAHQKGWFPVDVITVVLRDGTVTTINDRPAVYNDVNYIR